MEELSATDQYSAERLRRMKALMRQIHQEEFEAKKFRIRPIKGRSLILFISAVSLILFGVTALYNFNLLVTLEEKVLSTQGHLEYALQRRINLFGNLVNLALNQASLEREIFRNVNDGRAALGGDHGGEWLNNLTDQEKGGKGGNSSPAMSALTNISSLDRLLALVEQYPDVKVSGSYQKLMDKLVELEDRISQRADEHNEQVRIYNTMITSYPWTVLAQMTGFKRYGYYETKQRYEDFPKLTLESFRPLLPENSKQKASSKNVVTTPMVEVPQATGESAPSPLVAPDVETGKPASNGKRSGP